MNWDRVWDILMRECGAPESLRADFLYRMGQGVTEFRFQGKLGYGGKYRPNVYSKQGSVSCYAEDLTPERVRAIRAADKALRGLKVDA